MKEIISEVGEDWEIEIIEKMREKVIEGKLM